MNARELRVGLVGFGLAGAVFHAPLIVGTSGLALTTVVTTDPERAARARREHPGVAVETSAEALWARPDAHDLVVIATANDAHAALAMRALDAGIPTVVDKPLAPTSREAREVIQHAERRGVMLAVFHNRRWDSDQLTLRRLLAEGALGDVHRCESRIERWRPTPRPGAWREETPPERGGGVLLDLGTHLVDQAVQLFGPVTAVAGEVSALRGGAADDDAFVALTHESGVRSHLSASSVAAAPGPRLRVLGNRGAFVVDLVDGQEDALLRGERPGEGWGAEPPDRWGRLVRGDESEPVPSEPATGRASTPSSSGRSGPAGPLPWIPPTRSPSSSCSSGRV